ncbi:MAG TPA: ABC-F family ATP-binding cassette domain-containing protein [Oligoflexus sp.]|uniref:ABC-F family ATP-binding cassette domain-containing protein n=1 Tax=Oligoflexus sp. TaxID=1971216 RepID=UPI002D432F6D|nr:ABC-F family ATP-binding cassette domain-containing protein [Oligoflexus sp.]HYX36561.1 ABC-F family ATP-binding cassette domain-containing protein [Oligoflexus sp.]
MIHLTNLTKRHGQRVLYENASIMIREGDRIGLVGPNGAGKTTIFRLIMKEDHPDAGSITIPPNTVVGYFSQDVGEMRGRSALEQVMASCGRVSELGAFIAEVEAQLASGATSEMDPDAFNQLMERYGDAQMEFQQRDGYDLESRAQAVLTGLGIGPNDYNRSVEQFSGGWKMRIALAGILTLQPDVLLMDEPTNHLDIESIVWLEEWLQSYKGAIMMTSHDREFMNRLVNRIVEIAHKQVTVYSGNYEFYLREREQRREQQAAAHRRQQEMLAKEEDFIARFAARASHAAQVQSRVKKLEKIDRLEAPPETRTIDFTFPSPPRSGNDVARLTDLSKVWTREDGTQRQVFRGVSGVIQRLNKIALTGVNGAGKSTLLKTIVGETDPTQGAVAIGPSVRVGYFSQHALDLLNPNSTIFEEISSRLPDATIGFIRNLLGAFLFSGDDVHKKIAVLSGGERSRVLLALILASPLNFLVLDEPTNHLDIESREVLLKAVQEFDGTVLVVSHDRHFLRAVANRVFEIRDGELRVYEGNYDYYVEKGGVHLG